MFILLKLLWTEICIHLALLNSVLVLYIPGIFIPLPSFLDYVMFSFVLFFFFYKNKVFGAKTGLADVVMLNFVDRLSRVFCLLSLSGIDITF